jgi:hypothetical protein
MGDSDFNPPDRRDDPEMVNWKPSQAALDEWGADAAAFQRWYERLPEHLLNRYFGLTRTELKRE